MSKPVSAGIGEPYFDKFTTNVIKGIALIMMFLHHFFTFPEWWLDGIEYPFMETIAPYFRAPFELCVPIFCFLTGYFYAFRQSKTFRYSLKKISDLLLSYWCVFFVFALIAVCGGYRQYTVGNFVKECFALSRPTMVFCWYVAFYLISMLVLPCLTKIMSKNIHVDLLIAYIGAPLAFRLLAHFIPSDIIRETLWNTERWFPCILTGYLFAEYRFFPKIQNINDALLKRKWMNIVIWSLMLLLVPMGRLWAPDVSIGFAGVFSLSVSIDAIYAPAFIYLTVNLSKSIGWKHPPKILFFIGKYSMLMWFVSCIFFNPCKSLFQPILYLPQNPILVMLWGLLLCFAASFVFDLLTGVLLKLKNKLLFPSTSKTDTQPKP